MDHELRKDSLGGSDLAVVLGVSPFMTALELYEVQTGQREPQEETWNMRRGKLLEDELAEWYEAETGFGTQKVEEQKAVGTPDWLRISPDLDVPGTDRIGEIKVILNWQSQKQWGDPGTDEIAHYYYPQAQSYIYGYHLAYGGPQKNWCDFIVEMGERTPLRYQVRRDDGYINDLLLPAGQLYMDNKRAGIAPPPSNPKEAERAYGMPVSGKVVEADQAVVELVEQLREAEKDLKQAERMFDHFKMRVQEVLGDAEELRDGPRKLVTWKSRRFFAEDVFREKYPELAAEFDVVEERRKLDRKALKAAGHAKLEAACMVPSANRSFRLC